MISTATLESLLERYCEDNDIVDYTVKYDKRKNRLGACQFRPEYEPDGSFHPIYQSYTFHFSLENLKYLSYAETLELVRHEVAHALTDPKKGHHGLAWKMNMLALGGKPERCHEASEEQQEAMAKWVGTCPNGHKSFRHRLTEKARRVSCGQCSRHFDPRYKFTWKERR